MQVVSWYGGIRSQARTFWEEEAPSYHEPQHTTPLAGENVMNVIVVGAECAPWSKTGGFALLVYAKCCSSRASLG